MCDWQHKRFSCSISELQITAVSWYHRECSSPFKKKKHRGEPAAKVSKWASSASLDTLLNILWQIQSKIKWSIQSHATRQRTHPNPCNLLHSRPLNQFMHNHYNCLKKVAEAKQCNQFSLLVYLGLEERGLTPCFEAHQWGCSCQWISNCYGRLQSLSLYTHNTHTKRNCNSTWPGFTRQRVLI